jgi:photosystem II stability/assembly factor-like uncharacterized protein
MVLQENVTSLAFAARVAKDGPLWAGTDSGGVLTSSDGGLTWTSLSSPQAGAAVVALAARAGTVAAATFEAGRRQVTVWRSTNGGQTWEEWLQEAADLPSVHLGLTGQGDDGDLVCVGRTCRRFTRSGWQPSFEAESPILRLCQISDPTGWLLLTASQVLRSDDGRRWVPYGEGLAGGQLADLVVLPSTARGQVACALGIGGLVWRRVAPGTVAVAGRSSSQGTTSTGH